LRLSVNSTLVYCLQARLLPTRVGLKGYAPALPSNIRLGWKWLRVTSTLAYYVAELITAVKSIVEQAAGKNVCI